MLFNSPFFLFCFLPIFLLVYLASRGNSRNIVAVLGSALFYAWGEPTFIVVVIGSAVLDWYVGNALFKSTGNGARKLLLSLSVICNIGIIAYYKYADFLCLNLNVVLGHAGLEKLPLAHIVLPIGVSFIVFEKITYAVDIYRRNGRPAPTFLSYLLYVLLFPKLLSGPIIKYHDIQQQLFHRQVSREDVIDGVTRFCTGLGKKVLIADSCGELVDAVFGLGPGELGFFNAWSGAICFSIQIYFDFSGYSDMAIGLSRIMGFRIMENFNMPYTSSNFTEFWRRWHISLSTWIREYLYIPLGGSRRSGARTYINLWICFLLSGLWHGANWTFILWGIYHGTFLALDKLFWQKRQAGLPRALNVVVTFFLVTVGWVLFRSHDITQIGYYLSAMVNPAAGGTFIHIGNHIVFFGAVGCMFCFVRGSDAAHFILRLCRFEKAALDASVIAACVVFLLALGKISTLTYNPFLYFRF
jgi:alginate O-acetyltransferase complex protein AlgI